MVRLLAGMASMRVAGRTLGTDRCHTPRCIQDMSSMLCPPHTEPFILGGPLGPPSLVLHALPSGSAVVCSLRHTRRAFHAPLGRLSGHVRSLLADTATKVYKDGLHWCETADMYEVTLHESH